MKTEIREKEEKAGSMEAWSYAQYAGETKRERNTENSISKNNALTQRSLQCVCSMHTFIQVLWRTDRSTIVLQCS